jgi:hypothetical protein
MSFFNKFPKIDYDINLDGVTQKLIDFSRVVDVNDVLAIDSTAYIKYDIIDGARPDVISQLLYDTPDYYWTFFILNDHLKSGYHQWPKSEVALEKFIDEKYKNALILTIPTQRTSISSLYGGGGNFPFNEFVTVKNLDNPIERAYWKSWDTNTYQAYFEKTNNTHFNSAQINISFPEFVNPYNVFSREYAETEIFRSSWNKSIYEYYLNSPGGVYLIQQWRSSIETNITVVDGTDASYQLFANYLSTIPWTDFANDRKYHVSPKLAPRYYTNSSGEEVSAFEAYYPNNNTPFSDPFSDGNFITNYAAEVKLNDDLSQIKVIRPDRVAEFSSRFKELINE